MPKLFVKAEPGGILADGTVVDLVRRWPAQTEKTVAGIHFVQEDLPDEIGGPSPAGWGTCNGPSSSTQTADRLDDRTIAGSNVDRVSSDRGDRSRRRAPREGKWIGAIAEEPRSRRCCRFEVHNDEAVESAHGESACLNRDDSEVLVLGSGAGGKLVAWHMARSGQRTAVVERRWIGGACPNIACMPSKKSNSAAPKSRIWPVTPRNSAS